MTEPTIHRAIAFAIIALGAITFVSLLFIAAPYGRYAREGWGPKIPARLGWIVMEAPASLVFAALYLLGPHAREAAPLAMFALWQLHYVHRAFVFPFRMRTRPGRTMPITIPLLAIAFNLPNAYLNARWISALGAYPTDWLRDARFVLGAAVFLAGFAINYHADAVLFALRAPGRPAGYQIPRGGLYRYISCPNYFGEIVEWCGWALLTWSLAGLSFALYTVANLAPRALTHHKWYHRQFPDYPPERKALIPFVV